MHEICSLVTSITSEFGIEAGILYTSKTLYAIRVLREPVVLVLFTEIQALAPGSSDYISAGLNQAFTARGKISAPPPGMFTWLQGRDIPLQEVLNRRYCTVEERNKQNTVAVELLREALEFFKFQISR